ncbi:DUF3067 domain-containing protein [Chloropicon roscoffensis]|uniref:DUF3067 domain-containing protein n=1 Tax=Chloropicon roscoffensis TaxID=1461544 RepID=A0AAX4PFI0_9CHLO
MSALLERTRLRVGAARPRTIPPCRGPARAGAPARFQRPRGLVARAAPEDDREEPSRDELIAKLNKSLEGLDEPMDGEELKSLVMERWGRAYDTRICRRRDGLGAMRLYLQVMWKYLGQRSFPMSEERYDEQLGAVAELISEWGCADQIRKEIAECEKNPVLDTTGANAVMIALDIQDGQLGDF